MNFILWLIVGALIGGWLIAPLVGGAASCRAAG
jgi:hypothetical protein